MNDHSEIERKVVCKRIRCRFYMALKRLTGRCCLFFVSFLFGLLFSVPGVGNDTLSEPDSTIHFVNNTFDTVIPDRYQQISHKNRISNWIFGNIVREPEKTDQGRNATIEYYRMFEGKTIAGIRIKPLSVFGPTFADTTNVPSSWIESFANRVHFQTSMIILRKNIRFHEGDAVDPFVLSENEKFIRDLPYINDVSFRLEQSLSNPDQVFITVLTKDVYSFGVSGKISGVTTGNITLYNNNIFGIGHQLSVKLLGYLQKTPAVGVETFYSIHNIVGSLIDLKAGYTDNYKQKGILFNLNREFKYSTTAWAGGVTFDRFYRSKKLASGDPVSTDDPLQYRYFDGWMGLNIPFSHKKYQQSIQLTLAGRLSNTYFFVRPDPDIYNEQFFADNTLYLLGITLSTHNFQKSNLIYSYGITEDIPSGYLYELVGGYSDGEFLKRYYTHLVLSKGIVTSKQDYFYSLFKIGGYWDKGVFEQGQVEMNVNYITRLFKAPLGFRYRQFVKLNYIRGIKRFEIENLYMNYMSSRYGIRGLLNGDALGKQRLCLKTESVFFQRPAIFGFNIAWYGFADFGLIGDNNESIFNQKFFSGVGVGIRIRNESLVFKTLQIQVGYYPGYKWGFNLSGFGRTSFDQFQPVKPTQLLFE
jgi:hypothetical protein